MKRPSSTWSTWPTWPAWPARHRLGVAAAGAVLVASVVNAPARADTAWHVDPTGDVQKSSSSQTTVSPTGWTDIVGVSVDHRADVLRIGSSIRGYRGLQGSWAVTLVTSTGDRYVVHTTLDTPPGQEDEVRFQRAPRHTAGSSRSAQGCEGLRLRRSDRGNSIDVPTTCLGNPWRVRIGIRTYARGPYGEASVRSYRDDAFSDGRTTFPSGSPTEQQPTLSSWIARG